MPREISETYTTIDPEAACTSVTGHVSGFPIQAWITSPDPVDPTTDHLIALPTACRSTTSAAVPRVDAKLPVPLPRPSTRLPSPFLLRKKRGAPSIHILNVYCAQHLQRVTFTELFYRALQAAARQPLVVIGDFNAPSSHWGYHYEKARGRQLKELISTLGFTLLTDPAHPTRLGNSVTRDTCPDLSLTQNIRHATWENLEDNLGSDHFLLWIAFPTQKMRQIRGPARITDWSAFRTTPFPLLPSPQPPQYIPTSSPFGRHATAFSRRCRRAKLNRKLRSRIEALTLADTNWVDSCMKAASEMSSKSTWRLLRSLLDPSTTRGETQCQLRRVYYACQGPTSQLANHLCDRYLCRIIDPKGTEAVQVKGNRGTYASFLHVSL
ncbi:hypothetical protein HPB49_008408 [Dermacentor silvarum]|uniref:Uncharacterized protein n=1 Tax=Dermacentor silvarum TaxID=543639 RepID=A0ACB8DXZ9_DERSI|nr:hypothetical protein HPB49_008408 [Dermacentor silvarum]